MNTSATILMSYTFSSAATYSYWGSIIGFFNIEGDDKDHRKEVSFIKLQGNALLFYLILLLITCCAKNASDNTGIMVNEGPESFQQMIKESETIVVAHKTGVATIISSENVITTIHLQFEVSEELKGNPELGQQKVNIETLEQLRAWRDEGQEKYILFLEPRVRSKEERQSVLHG